MNVVKLYGGLGNQMFQYAFGRAMSENGLQVKYDNAWFNKPSDPPRPYGLNKFIADVRLSDDHFGLQRIHETDETYYRFNPKYLNTDNAYFMGYWQNRKYMEGVLPNLKIEFRIRPEYRTEEYVRLKAMIHTADVSTAIHIRRGDYLTHGHHLLPVEYYKKALAHVRGTVFLFSDDLAWSKQQFPDSIPVDMEDYLCLDLMRSCTNKITANSTFSWWAGILGEVEGGKTFAPLKWRLNDTEEGAIIEEKFIPENWIRI